MLLNGEFNVPEAADFQLKLSHQEGIPTQPASPKHQQQVEEPLNQRLAHISSSTLTPCGCHHQIRGR